ncbi:MAG TPA: anti-sigma factor [Patescibacteria group bacterium]|nr:anti-sigma factor [Patescibacteria group bacterium]
MNHDDCARLAALAPAAALGALDPDEAAFLRAHLAACSRPHPELRDAVELAAAIGGAWPDEDAPSAQLRSRLLEAVRAEASAPVTPRARPTTGRTWWRPMAVGATSLALAASLALAVQVGENGALRDQLADARTQITAMSTELDTAEAWIERAVATGADAFFMSGEGRAAEASFMLVVEADAAGAVLLMSGLPDLAPGQTYELWVERDGVIVGVGTFRPDERGLAAVTIDASLHGIRQAMITVEPEGGSEAPTQDDVIMQGDLTL